MDKEMEKKIREKIARFTSNVKHVAKTIAEKAKPTAEVIVEKSKHVAKNVAENAKPTAEKVAKEAVKLKNRVVSYLDDICKK